jgi:hypothetical protein
VVFEQGLIEEQPITDENHDGQKVTRAAEHGTEQDTGGELKDEASHGEPSTRTLLLLRLSRKDLPARRGLLG